MTDTITIIGNLAYDPEQKVIPGGVTVTNFRVGSTHRRYDKNSNQWIDQHTNWYAVSAYRALGENAFASLHKGDRVIVTGKLRLREWDNGTKKGLAVEIDADAVGHDLLWGVSTFAKSRGAAPEPIESEEPEAPTPAATDAHGWVVPAAAPPAELVDTPF